MKNERIGFCLSGGGAAGVFQAGVLYALRGLWKNPPLELVGVSGASVGSLNLAMIAQKKTEDLKDMWLSIRRRDVYSYSNLWKLGFGASYFSSRPLQRLIEQHVELELIRQCPYRLMVMATERDTGRPQVVTERDPDFHSMLLASASIPVAFPQIWSAYRNCWYIDGGVADNSPLEPLMGGYSKGTFLPCTRIIAIHCHPSPKEKGFFSHTPEKRPRVLSRVAMALNLHKLMLEEMQSKDERIIELFNCFVERGIRKGTITKIHHIYPQMEISTLRGFGNSQLMREGFAHGAEKGNQFARTFLGGVYAC